ncbi:MAG: metallophosphoesterase [Anaerolineae bacterium]|nr:metallophosphoesterase [Anaerolineae bacterium]
MLIGVFSDVHDNLENLHKTLEIFNAQRVGALIFCGDFCSPIPSRVIAGEFKGDIHCVFGNGDGDRFAILNAAHTQYPNLKLHGEYAELEFEGIKIAVTHYPFYAKALARTGDYQAVFSGHTHQRHQEKIGHCLWLNPGEVLGWQGEATCAIYDTATNSAEFVRIGV